MPSRFARCFAPSRAVLAPSLAVLALAVAGGGCASSAKPAAAAEQAPAAPAKSELASSKLDLDAYAKLGYRLKWTGYASVADKGRLHTFEQLGDLIVAQDTQNVVSAISPTSGELKWVVPLASPLTKFVGATRDRNTILISSESELFFLDVDGGTLLTKQKLDRVVSTKAVGVGPILVYGTSVGEVLGHLLNGFKAWGYAVGGAFDASPVLVGSQYVGLVSQNGAVIIVDPSTGSAASRYQVFGGMACDPAASDDTLFVASLDQSIYAFPLFGSQPAWRKRTDSKLRTTPTYHGGRLYVHVPSAGLLCLDARTGKELWTAKGVAGTVVAAQRGDLIVWDGSSATRLDAKNGDTIASAKLEGVFKLTPEKFVDGHLYTVMQSGAIHKFEIK